MKLVVQLAAGRGELDAEADEIRVEGGALMLFRDHQPVLILAARTWTVVHPAGQGPKRPLPTRQAEPPEESSEILEQAVIADTVGRGW